MTRLRRCCDRGKAWITICTLISNCAYATIAPFLPIECDRKGVPATWVGPIFALYSVGVILTSPLVAKMAIPRVGNRNAVSIGMALMGTSLASFGLVMYGDSPGVIIGTSMVVRFAQGTASAFIQTTCYVIATNDYPDEKEQVVGLVEATTGVGLILGPVVGSLLCDATNFETTFFILGAVIFAIAFATRFCFHEASARTSRIAAGDEDRATRGDDSEEDEATISAAPPATCAEEADEEDGIMREGAERPVATEEEVSIYRLVKNPRFSLALVGGAVCYFMYCFLEPILSRRLIDFHLTVPQIGLFFGLFPLFYIPSSMCVQWIPAWIEKRVTISLSVAASSASFFLIGPSQLLRFPDSLLMVGFGWSLLGITLAAFLVPILPEMVESSLPSFPGQEQKVNNISSGLFNSFLGIGQILAPFYGATLYERVGFRLTNDIAALLGITFFVAHFSFTNVPEAFRTSRALGRGPTLNSVRRRIEANEHTRASSRRPIELRLPAVFR